MNAAARLTPQQMETGRRSPRAREKRSRTIQARNAVTWLKRQVQKSKLPDEVRAPIDRLFVLLGQRVNVQTIDEDVAQREAHRIAARIHWIRHTHKMLSMEPTDNGFMTVSKVTAQWTLMEGKLNGHNTKGKQSQIGRKAVPTARTRQSESGEHETPEDQVDDGETA